MEVQKIVVCEDVATGEEAIYIDGKLVFHAYTVHSREIAAHADGKQSTIQHRLILRIGETWPDKLTT